MQIYLSDNVRHKNSVAKSWEVAYNALKVRTDEYFKKLDAERQECGKLKD